ncbi:MAG: ATP-binding cassette domain-containing protein [Oscillatoria sp. SIO1A7]|nr:ATP-binding cassette domain-containing protein [Oscillatoria sp. SIO1A7]
MSGNIGQQTVVGSNPYLQLNNRGQTIRLELEKKQHTLGRDRAIADLVVPPDWLVISRCQAILTQSANDYHIYDGDGQKSSSNGLFLERTRITPDRGHPLTNGTEIWIGQNPKDQILLAYFNPLSGVSPPKERSISLQNRSVLLGRDPNANFQLDAPIVSRRHATIEPAPRGGYLLRDYSTNGVFVNNERVSDRAKLNDGDAIRIGPFTLVLRGDELELLDRGNEIRLDAESLIWEVPEKRGMRKRLLDNISLAIEPGQFVALVGGSGAGKSSLMRTLLGINRISSGKVYLNGDDLRKNFNIYRTQIGYVPQDDIIHKQLTVTEVLTYAAKLRLPPDTEVEPLVKQTLDMIEMSDRDRRNTLVGKLSGGQRKRVSIGVELLADPKLFFLDEPTSGLDPGLEKKMMELLRKLADQGRTIILVTHATANIKLCDRIAFLGRGGRLCYFGSPAEVFDFFHLTSGDFAEIYNQLETDASQVKQWAELFRQSPYYQRYITNHLSTGDRGNSGNAPQQVKPSPWQQFSILAQRYWRLILRDRLYLTLTLLTAPAGIGLIPFALRDKNPLIGDPEPTLAPLALRVLFVFTCAAIWVGLSASLQEIVKETAIYLRERLVNLGLWPYLHSKLFVLGSVALLQTLLMTGAILLGFQNPEPELISWQLGLGITSFLTLFASLSLGLLVSAVAKNSAQANSALPLLLLPQIIFSGVLFKMEGFASKLSWFMLSRWSVGAYGALVDVNAMVPEEEILNFYTGEPIPMPFDPTPVYEPAWQNLALNWGMLLLHAAIYLGLTWCWQKRKDSF